MGKKLLNITKWSLISALTVLVAFLGFVYLTPGYDIAIVRSGSMEPNLPVGSVIVTAPANSLLVGELEVGQPISFTYGKDTVTHRIIEINDNQIIVKGDANEHADANPVNLSQVKGIVWFNIPYFGYFTGFLQTKLGWWLLILLPTFGLVSMLVWGILKEAFKPSKPKEVVSDKP